MLKMHVFRKSAVDKHSIIAKKYTALNKGNTAEQKIKRPTRTHSSCWSLHLIMLLPKEL